MNFLSRFAIPGLIRYVVVLSALVYLLHLMGQPVVEFAELNPALILQGQLWRLVTWIFIPTNFSIFWVFIYFSFTWWVGDLLEAYWGTARLNLYYLLGVVGCSAASFIFAGGAGGEALNSGNTGSMVLNLSLVLALATVAPEIEILLMFVIPVKMKYLALLSLVYPWGVWLVAGNAALKAAAVVCLANYLIFFGPTLFKSLKNRQKVEMRRAQFEASKREVPATLHRCEACGITELTDPDADFRVTADGREFCVTHLPKG